MATATYKSELKSGVVSSELRDSCQDSQLFLAGFFSWELYREEEPALLGILASCRNKIKLVKGSQARERSSFGSEIGAS